jgi:hypothetical protein
MLKYPYIPPFPRGVYIKPAESRPHLKNTCLLTCWQTLLILCRLKSMISPRYFFFYICRLTFCIHLSRRKIQVFKKATPFRPKYSYGRFGEKQRLHLQGPAMFPLQMEPLNCYEMSLDLLSLKQKTLRNSKLRYVFTSRHGTTLQKI